MTFSTIITIAIIVIVFIVLFKVFKLMLRLLLVAVFLFLAYVTNPDPDQHQDAVSMKAGKDNIDMKKIAVEVDDYYVCSLTHVISDGEKKLVGAGAFTQVVIFRSLQ